MAVVRSNWTPSSLTFCFVLKGHRPIAGFLLSNAITPQRDGVGHNTCMMAHLLHLPAINKLHPLVSFATSIYAGITAFKNPTDYSVEIKVIFTSQIVLFVMRLRFCPPL